MNFEFKSSEAALERAVRSGGLGLTSTQTGAVRTWQSGDYKFNLHTGYHGGDNHYIYVFSGSRVPSSNVPRVFITGDRAGTYVAGAASANLRTRDITDVQNVVRANRDLFVTILRNYYNIR